MGYSVHVFPLATHSRFVSSVRKSSFFENPGNLSPFSNEQLEEVCDHLELVGFGTPSKEEVGRVFHHEEWSARALLTERGLYLSAPMGSDGVFEIGMLASEMSAGGIVEGLAKFDPQDGSWESGSS